MSLHTCIDHIVITAPSLDQGADYLRQALGVDPQPGGEHSRMGTHNRLLKLGRDLYLEIIAVDPQAGAPERPRWFQLDDPDWNCRPQLATWVARTNDIHAAHAATSMPIGDVQAMTRANLDWLITIPEDGSLALQGAAPGLIQWNVPMHPANGMPDSGCSLIRLEAFHPEAEKLIHMLDCIGFEGAFSAFPLEAGAQPYLLAHIQTPSGPRQLGGIGAHPYNRA